MLCNVEINTLHLPFPTFREKLRLLRQFKAEQIAVLNLGMKNERFSSRARRVDHSQIFAILTFDNSRHARTRWRRYIVVRGRDVAADPWSSPAKWSSPCNTIIRIWRSKCTWPSARTSRPSMWNANDRIRKWFYLIYRFFYFNSIFLFQFYLISLFI